MKKTATAKPPHQSKERGTGKRLRLHRETVRLLEGVELEAVGGGMETQISREPNAGVC